MIYWPRILHASAHRQATIATRPRIAVHSKRTGALAQSGYQLIEHTLARHVSQRLTGLQHYRPENVNDNLTLLWYTFRQITVQTKKTRLYASVFTFVGAAHLNAGFYKNWPGSNP